MMTKKLFRKRWYLFIPLIALAILALGLITMALWNALMPVIFHLTPITFAQALGLLILSRILLGGMSGHKGGGPHQHFKNNLREKWENMTPEEREKCRQGWHNTRFWCREKPGNTTTADASKE